MARKLKIKGHKDMSSIDYREMSWRDKAACASVSTDIFFSTPKSPTIYQALSICKSCPVRKDCFSVGISGKEWGVWGGVYLENGEISKEFSSHKTKSDWGSTWQSLTLE
jgi:hypothetical protein